MTSKPITKPKPDSIKYPVNQEVWVIGNEIISQGKCTKITELTSEDSEQKPEVT